VDAAPTLIAAFADEDDRVVRASMEVTAAIGAPAVPLLRESFQHESPRERAATIDALGAIGADAKGAIDDLIAALTDVDRDVRHRAVKALERFGAEAEGAIAALIAVMQNPRDQEATRQAAIKALARIAPTGHEQAIAALRESTKDPNYGVKSLAEQILKEFEASAEVE